MRGGVVFPQLLDVVLLRLRSGALPGRAFGSARLERP